MFFISSKDKTGQVMQYGSVWDFGSGLLCMDLCVDEGQQPLARIIKFGLWLIMQL